MFSSIRPLVASLLLVVALTANAQQPSPQALALQFAELAQPANGRVGAAAMLIETGELVTLAGNERFPMQSVFKLPIALLVVRLVQQDKLQWEQKIQLTSADMRAGRSPIRDANPQGIELSVQELVRYMVSESDNTACDKLLELVGGPAQVTRYLQQTLGVTDVNVATTEQEMFADPQAQYRSWATPAGMAQLLAVLQKGHKSISPDNRALLLRYLTDTPTGTRRLKALLPAGTVVAHKTGLSATVNGVTAATNDVGIITLPSGQHLAVAVFVSDARASEEAREAVIARIAQATYQHWTAPKAKPAK